MLGVSPAGHQIPIARHIEQACKPSGNTRCGVEFEMLGFRLADNTRLDSAGIAALMSDFGCPPAGAAKTMLSESSFGILSSEPGGQLEFAGLPHRDLLSANAGLERFLSWLRTAARSRGYAFFGIGFDPFTSGEFALRIRNHRYLAMRAHFLGQRGRGVDMMCHTAGIQCNLDFTSPLDMSRKFLAAIRLAPVCTAMFANSPFAAGRLTSLKSNRAAVWLATDHARTTPPEFTARDEFTPEDVAEWVVHTPLIFVRRNGTYLDAHGETLLDLWSREESPNPLQDFLEARTTIFTDVRLKDVVEIRCADSGAPEDVMAFQALWKGLLYDPAALAGALKLAPKLSLAATLRLGAAVAAAGLEAESDGVKVLPLAKQMLALARQGLKTQSPQEAHFLDPLEDRVTKGRTPADKLIRLCQTKGLSVASAVQAATSLTR